MEKLSIEKLQEIIENHGKWLIDSNEGSKANLCDANLRGADMCDANLCGADLCGANLRDTNLPKQIIQIGPIGSRKSQTIYNVTDDIVQCGCWNNCKGGTLEEFELRVANEYGVDNKKYYNEYMTAIAMFKMMKDNKW